MKNAVTITIMHNIFLTREERYRLVAGEGVETTGVSVPVWFYRGVTNEPAQEVFCKYKLTNNPVPVPINISEEGYVVNLPQSSEKMFTIADPSQENPGVGQTVPPPDVTNLKDIKDGGAEFLQFKQYAKVRRGKQTYNLLHFVEIKTVEDLKESLNYP